ECAGAAGQYDSGGGRRIKPAEHCRIEKPVTGRCIALHEIACIRKRAHHHNGEPDLKGCDGGDICYRLIWHKRQHHAGDDEELRGGGEFCSADLLCHFMKPIACAGEQHNGNGDGDRYPERLCQRDGAEKIDKEIADQRDNAAAEALFRLALSLWFFSAKGQALPVPDGEPCAENDKAAQKEISVSRCERIEKRTCKGEQRKGAYAARRLQRATAEIFLKGHTEKKGEDEKRHQPFRLEQIARIGGEKFGQAASFIHVGS